MIFDVEDLVKEASGVLRTGGVIIYPTETVYGLGGNAFDENVVRKIFKIKGREEGRPLIVLVKDFKMAGQVADLGNYEQILKKYWPGPLTGVFKATVVFPEGVVSKEGNIAIRISPHQFVQKVFESIDFPLISTSANRSGDKSSLTVAEARASLGSNYDLVDHTIGCGALSTASPSTVVNFTVFPPKVLRQGTFKFIL